MANKREGLSFTGLLGALSLLLGLFLIFVAPGAMQAANAAVSPVPIDCRNPSAYGYNAVELANNAATIELNLAGNECPLTDGGQKVTYYLMSYSAKDNAPYPSGLPSGGDAANYPQTLADVVTYPGPRSMNISADVAEMTVSLPSGTNSCWQLDLAANSIPGYTPPQELTFNASTVPPMTLPIGFFWGLAGPDSSCNSYGTTTTTTTTTTSTSTTTTTSTTTSTTATSTTTTSSTTTSSTTSTSQPTTTTTTVYVPHIYIPPPPTTTTTTTVPTTTTLPTTTTRPRATTTTLPPTTTTTVATKSRHSTTTTTVPPTTTTLAPKHHPTTTTTRPPATTTTLPPTTTTLPKTPPTTVPKSLAYTGSDSVTMLAVGLGLILAGGVLLMFSTGRRRRHA